MASDIRIDVMLPRHRKYRRLQRAIGVVPMAYLVNFWIAVAEQCPTGELVGWTADDIEDAACWDGDPGMFLREAVAVGFIDETEKGDYAPHDWAEHQPWAAAAESRSDTGRFNKMKDSFPREHGLFVASGRKGISKEDYELIKSSNNPLSTAQALLKQDGSKPKQGVTPSPSPSPSPKPKSKPTAADENNVVVDLKEGGAEIEKPHQQQMRRLLVERREAIIELTGVEADRFDLVGELCVRHYGSKAPPVDCYAKILAWFKREFRQPAVRGQPFTRGDPAKQRAAEVLRQEATVAAAREFMGREVGGGARSA